MRKCLLIVIPFFVLCFAGCRPKQARNQPPAAPPKQNLVVLLSEPDGKTGKIEVSNAAGAQALDQPNQAVKIERPDLKPGQPFVMDKTEIERLFGASINALPAPEAQFIFYFNEGKDELDSASKSLFPAVNAAIQDRHSTAITIIGHTDTTGSAESNYQLGLRRAQRLADMLVNQGIEASYMFVSSHGEADPIVKTLRGVAEQRNRRVEVIVR
jgi:outer membrane protein OmpA-like peptidoglycan-associated protein